MRRSRVTAFPVNWSRQLLTGSKPGRGPSRTSGRSGLLDVIYIFFGGATGPGELLPRPRGLSGRAHDLGVGPVAQWQSAFTDVVTSLRHVLKPGCDCTDSTGGGALTRGDWVEIGSLEQGDAGRSLHGKHPSGLAFIMTRFIHRTAEATRSEQRVVRL